MRVYFFNILSTISCWHYIAADFCQVGTVRKKESNVEKVELNCNLLGQREGSVVFESTVNYLIAFVTLDAIEF